MRAVLVFLEAEFLEEADRRRVGLLRKETVGAVSSYSLKLDPNISGYLLNDRVSNVA